jgi:hypothetical protein
MWAKLVFDHKMQIILPNAGLGAIVHVTAGVTNESCKQPGQESIASGGPDFVDVCHKHICD